MSYATVSSSPRSSIRRGGRPDRPSARSLFFEPLEDRRVLSGASIAGALFEDLTGNGISADDPATADRSVRLFLDNGDGAFDAGSDALVDEQDTHPNGGYAFHGLSAGTYFVEQDLPLGWDVLGEHGEDEIITPDQAGLKPRERNDTLATAIATGLSSAASGRYVAAGEIGDNNFKALDVDLFRIQANTGDQVHIDIDATTGFGSTLDATLRVFDASGILVTANEDESHDVFDPHLEFIAPATGDYYLGVSGFANFEYNPTAEGSGAADLSGSQGEYTIEIEVGPRHGAEPVTVELAAGEHHSDVNLASARLGSISGQMFEDLDGDGIHDPGEPGLSNQVVVLHYAGAFFSHTMSRSIDLNNDGTIDPTTEAGLYSFNDLLPGIYFVRNRIAFGIAPGWTQVSPSLERPPGSGIGEVTSGEPTPPAVPGLIPDLTINLERGLFDWFVTGDVLHFAQATPNIGTGPMELRAGEDLGNGTQLVYQRIYQNTDLTEFIDVEAGTFSFHPEHHHIHFDDYAEFSLREALPDSTGDGIPEVGDIVVAGQKRSFCLVDVTPYDLDLPNADPDGSDFGCDSVQRISVGWMDIYDATTPGQQIDVSGLAPGDYWIQATVDPSNRLIEADETNNTGRALITIGMGDSPTAMSGAHGVPLSSGEAAAARDFAAFRLTSISGQVFQDKNANGQQNKGEGGLGGRAVFIDLNGDGVLNNPEGDNLPTALATEPFTFTDKQGNFLFTGVGPGTHQVRQIVPVGWTQTTANPAPIAAISGQNVTGLLFGNAVAAGGAAATAAESHDRALEALLAGDELDLGSWGSARRRRR